ncbi:MAG: hypothetical protein ACRDNZ_01340 [Streptosporangiaceae bacterium]
MPSPSLAPGGSSCKDRDAGEQWGELSKLDACTSQLLDYSADSDATNDTASFAVTVEASSLEDALGFGMSCIWSAIHASGGAMPDWDGIDSHSDVVIYQLDTDESVEVRQLVSS